MTMRLHTQTMQAPARAGAREWLALVVLTLPVLLVAVDATVLGFAVPALSEALQPTGNELLWIVDVYSFVLAGLLVTMGTLGDRIGRRRLLLFGAAGFGIASVLAAYAGSAQMLIGARALLGITGATLMPSTLSMLRSIFLESGQRRQAIAVWAAVASGGAALGPILGGVLLEHFWWGSVFLINVPVIVLLLVAGRLLLPESRDPAPGRFDALSAVLSLAAILPVVYAIKDVVQHGPGLTALLLAAVGLGLGVLFVRRQRGLADPMIDIGLFGDRVFTVGVLVNMFSVFALVGGFFVITQYLQLVLGMSPLIAALWLLPAMLADAGSALLAVRVARRISVHHAVSAGLLLAAAGFAVAMLLGGHAPVAVLSAGLLVLGSGTGIAYTLSNDAIMSAVRPEKAGPAAAISETAYELGAALGVAVLGSILAAGYKAGFVVPAGVGAAAAAEAEKTLGGAMVTAGRLPAGPGAALVDSARAAFTGGMDLVGVAAVVVLAGTAVLALTTLKARR